VAAGAVAVTGGGVAVASVAAWVVCGAISVACGGVAVAGLHASRPSIARREIKPTIEADLIQFMVPPEKMDAGGVDDGLSMMWGFVKYYTRTRR
jgi:hypothetical protein